MRMSGEVIIIIIKNDKTYKRGAIQWWIHQFPLKHWSTADLGIGTIKYNLNLQFGGFVIVS